MLQCRHKTFFSSKLFVPNSIPAAVSRRHIHFVDWRIGAHPRIPLGHSSRITREVDRHFRILKISHPIRNSEVKEIENGNDAEMFDFRQRLIGKRPVITIWSEINAVNWKSVTEECNIHLLHQLQIFAPMLVVAAFVKKIAAQAMAISPRD